MVTKPKKTASKSSPAKKKSNPKADKAAKVKSASKGTKPVKAAPPPDEVESRKLPGAKAIQQLSKDFLAASDRASTLAGKAGELISNAVKKIHLNAREFKRAHSLKSLGLRDPNKLRIALSDFDYYRQCLELDKLAGEGLFDAGEGRPEIVEDEEAEETASEDAVEGESDNVEHIDDHREVA